MAKKTLPAIEPEETYAVTLNRAVPFRKRVLRPQDDVRVKGKIIAELGDAVDSYEKV